MTLLALVAVKPTPWVGLAAIVAMFLLPLVPRSVWEGRPRSRPSRPPDLVEDRNQVRGTITRPNPTRDLEPWDGGS